MLASPLVNVFNCVNLTRTRYNAITLNLSPDHRVIAGPYSNIEPRERLLTCEQLIYIHGYGYNYFNRSRKSIEWEIRT